MKRILVAYATMAGSTAEVAKAVGEELTQGGWQVDVLPIGEVRDPGSYNAIVVGGPMIMGWHRSALGFLKKHRSIIQGIPLAVFACAMSLTKTTETSVDGIPVWIDENLAKPPKQAEKLSFKENYARITNYLSPILRAARPAKPVSLAVFGGRMEYGRLKWWAVLFAMLIIQAQAGDRRNWTSIRSWAASLVSLLNKEN
jgi:menaquinone-dependent protoporphyrinogen oxidase